MKCNKCSNEIPDNSKFCLHCGAKVEMVEEIVCPMCGFKNPHDARFCTECGKPLSDNKLTPTTLVQNWHSIRGVIKIEQNQAGKKYLSGKHDVMTGMLISPINKYLALVSNNDLYGVLHCDDSLVIPCIYDKIDLSWLNQNTILCCSKSLGDKNYNIKKHLKIIA